MVVGVFDNRQTELFAGALQGLGVKHALVVHGNDGLDEISCCDTTRVSELKDGKISSYEIYPEMLLGETFELSEIDGGDIAQNAAILQAVLSGEERGACRSVVLLNAAAACYVGGLADSLADGLRLAERAIDEGRAAEKLQILIQESKTT